MSEPVKIFCTRNPFDLRPAVDGILAAIERRRQTTDGKPLVVLMGENHNLPSHHMLQLMVIKKLCQDDQSLAYGIELPHNWLGTMLAAKTARKISRDVITNLEKMDSNGRRILTMVLAFTRGINSPVSHFTSQNFIRQKGLSVCFNDAAETGYKNFEPLPPGLDPEDPHLRNILERYSWENIGQNVDPRTPEGVSLRNIVLMENICTHAKNAKAKVYIQQCGMNHLFGRLGASNYEDSLGAKFMKAGIPFLSVFINTLGNEFDKYELPPEIVKNSIVIGDLPGDSYQLKPFDFKWDKLGDFDLENVGRLTAEATFIHRIAMNSSTEWNVFMPTDLTGCPSSARLALQREAYEQAFSWIAEAGATSAIA